jgi:hypothetical protein
MRDILDQIRLSLNNNLYYCALFVALSMPDICGAMESPDGQTDNQKYIKWFDVYVGSKYINFLSGEDCYYFRCSLLHQARSQHPKSNYARVIFVEPSVTTNIFHCNILNDALNLDVRIFCEDIITGVQEWLLKFEGTPIFSQNYNMFMRRYPNGLPPYIVGVPVIS